MYNTSKVDASGMGKALGSSVGASCQPHKKNVDAEMVKADEQSSSLVRQEGCTLKGHKYSVGRLTCSDSRKGTQMA